MADNALIVEAIRSGLRSSGAFQLLGYSHARNASARMIVDAGADAVLMDEADQSQQMLNLIKGIKEASDDVTVIVLTVCMEGEWLHRAFDAGASAAISKAVHPAALATLVRESLSGHIAHSLASLTVKDRSPKDAERWLRANRARTADLAARSGWRNQRRYCSPALDHPADRQVPCLQHLPQARRRQPNGGVPLRARKWSRCGRGNRAAWAGRVLMIVHRRAATGPSPPGVPRWALAPRYPPP